LPQSFAGNNSALNGRSILNRPTLWQQIHDTLGSEIGGRYPSGAKLPTEAELAQRFAVNRHTVRRALAALAEAGRIHVRRGAGAYVTQARLNYAIGPRTRFSQNLSAAGHTPERRLLRIETLAADPTERRYLGLPRGGKVHVAESVSHADGVPVAYKRMAFPAARLPDLPRLLTEAATITTALARCGVADYQRLWTRLTATRPGAIIARHLRMAETGPVLRSESLDVDTAEAPIEYGVAWFCSERIQLVVDRSSFP
jgi:GntR family phosphonate transport system transcriptional regulator